MNLQCILWGHDYSGDDSFSRMRLYGGAWYNDRVTVCARCGESAKVDKAGVAVPLTSSTSSTDGWMPLLLAEEIESTAALTPLGAETLERNWGGGRPFGDEPSS